MGDPKFSLSISLCSACLSDFGVFLFVLNGEEKSPLRPREYRPVNAPPALKILAPSFVVQSLPICPRLQITRENLHGGLLAHRAPH